MKFLHRYFVAHEDIRDMAATAHSYDDFYRVVRLCEGRTEDEAVYTQTWYHRHLHPTHLHAGRLNADFVAAARQKGYATSVYNEEEMGVDNLFQ
jgi:hypothetical protein